jgi:glutamine amidotransferase
MITIVDSGLGNIGSLRNMFRKIGVPVGTAGTPQEIEGASKLILPGVGSFDQGMRQLREKGFEGVLTDKVVQRGTPILGICLGMQLMTRGSEEGSQPGLGWLDATVVRFNPSEAAERIRLPHMGWNQVKPLYPSPLLVPIDSEIRYYFLHSFHVVCQRQEDVLGLTHHGYDFASVFRKGHIIGVQFHPEKSHRFGMDLLKGFANL